MDVKKILGNVALPEYSRLVYNLDSEGPGIKIVNKDYHRVFEVLHDSETIKLNSEGKLYLPLDGQTVFYDESEGLIKATGLTVSEGDAIKIDEVIINGVPQETINVLYDSETIVLDSEGKLSLPLDRRTIVVDSEGHISLPIDEKTIFVDSEDGLLKSKGLIVSEGQAIRIENSELDGVALAIINTRFDSETIVLDSENNLMVPIDRRTIVIDSEAHVAVPIDEITIVVNSEGKLEVSLEDGKATEVSKDSEGKAHVDVLVDEVAVFINSENRLEIRPDEERAFAVDSEGKLFVKVDDKTIKYDSEGKLFAIPEPLHDGIATKVVFGTSE